MQEWSAVLKQQIQKLPKQASNHVNDNKSNAKAHTAKGHVFGVPLTELMDKQRAMGIQLEVPQIMDAALKYFEREGTHCSLYLQPPTFYCSCIVYRRNIQIKWKCF